MIVTVLTALLCAYLARDMVEVRRRGPAATKRPIENGEILTMKMQK
jgi:hypothetical protein